MSSNDSGVINCNCSLTDFCVVNLHTRNIRIAGFEILIMLIVIMGVLLGIAVAGPYMWSARTIDVAVEEPLTVTNFPAIIRTRPGRNETLTIAMENAAPVNYTVTLTFTLEDAAYQTQYVVFSNYTYAIVPGTNQIGAWMVTDIMAPSRDLQLSVQFYRE